MVINGMVINVIFENKDNGYTVAHIESNGEKITIVGSMPSLYEGMYVQVTGKYVSNKKWGQQFDVQTCEVTEPNSEEDIIRYLSSGLIPGVGPVTAKNIVKMFGKDTLNVIEMNPLKLSNVKGVSLSKAADIGQAFLEIRKMQNSVIFLQKYGIGTNMAVKIFNKYGDMTEKLIKDNPYRLVEDITGIGFRTADKIAKNLGIAADSQFRIRAGIVFVLSDSSEKEGNTYLPIERMQKDLAKLLEIDVDENATAIQSVMDHLVLEGFVKILEIDGIQCVMLVKYYLMEQRIANKLLMLVANDTKDVDITEDISRYEQLNDVEFHQDQKKAIEVAVNNGVAVITGGPGTGKTTIIKCILSILKSQKKMINLLAPTGRAAKRMSESTGEDASTIHRAIMLDYGHKDDEDSFIRTERNPLADDVVIVDEVSMVDVQLMNNLLSALKPTAKLILVGDKNQLPSVGPGNVLADIIRSGLVPYAELTKIYRQNEKSLIITNAHAINNGKMPIIDNSS
ncbi:MAG: AAA family ATPase, partial [Clostridia bacterium]|nr:AAA family ATPase [Clostridia bacterium]